MGSKSEVGTYDELATFWMSCVPSNGSSGGPVVDNETGSVVGITRGEFGFLSRFFSLKMIGAKFVVGCHE